MTRIDRSYSILSPRRLRAWLLPLAVPLAALPVALWIILSWDRLAETIAGLPTVPAGFLASLLAGLATVLGALPILFIRRISGALEDGMLGFGAGVMLAAASFSLVMPGVEAAEAQGAGSLFAALIVAAGIGLGGLFLLGCERFVPHEHFVTGPVSGADSVKIKRVWLFLFAVTIHNFPEGLAVGVGFGSGDPAVAMALAFGIGLQNMPEGLVVALAVLSLGYSRARALGVALASGLVEPVGGLIGVGLVTLAQPLLPWALAFAGGAMIFVVSHEIIPESHRKGHERHATAGVMIGFMLMMVLDVGLQ